MVLCASFGDIAGVYLNCALSSEQSEQTYILNIPIGCQLWLRFEEGMYRGSPQRDGVCPGCPLKNQDSILNGLDHFPLST